MTRDELETMDEADLDMVVHDLKSGEAAEINNSGKDAQIAYILGEEPEPWCNHDAAAVRGGVCECGTRR